MLRSCKSVGNCTLFVFAIEKLTELQQTILLLFYQDELSLEEISMVLEMPVNTVKSHLFRAKN